MDKIKAVMIGHAVGDALGVPVEFFGRDELDKTPVTDMMGYGTHPVPMGAWSDDTSMALAALDSLASGRIEYGEIMQNFVRWADGGEYTPTGEMFDIGQTCHTAIRRYSATAPGDATECGCREEYANGNGSLMRIHPFSLLAWYRKQDWDAMIDRASALTHVHGCSQLACRIYTLVLLHLLDAPDKTSVGKALRMAEHRYMSHPEYSRYKRLLTEGFEKLPRDQIRSTGYVVDTMEAAIWCLMTTDSYRDCVLKAVNLGDDTDTTAAVAGGLAGALYGYGGIPKEWRDGLIKREYIEEMCRRASVNWSELYCKK